MVAGLRLDRAGQRWPQSPAGLSLAGLRFDRAGHRLASNAGRAIEVRGSSGTGVGRGRAGVPPHKLQGAGSIGARRPCVQFAAGAPRHDPTPRSRTRPTAGGWEEAVTDTGPLHSDHRRRFRSPQRAMGDGPSSPHPPAGRRRRNGRAGTGRGAPAANCTHGRPKATDPAPCSL
ncbi:hypothetical protein C0Q96_11840 [Streptomyces albidoflavus]|nr:hypothetical protein C0Q96_11840 [Streptomyces albidoflavus]